MDGERSTPGRAGAAPRRDRPGDPRRRHIVLAGLMGAGKTSVGLRLARLVGRPFVDSDMIVALDQGRTPVELEHDTDTETLHDAELAALRRVVADRDPVVYAAAASVMDADAADALADAWVVWLDGPPEVLADRLVGDHPRPALGDDPASTLRAQAAQRRARGRALADLCVDVTAGDPATLAAMIRDAWHERRPLEAAGG
jgi:shikimate kinase